MNEKRGDVEAKTRHEGMNGNGVGKAKAELNGNGHGLGMFVKTNGSQIHQRRLQNK